MKKSNLHRIVENSIKKVLKESDNSNLQDAIDLLVDAYEEISEKIKDNPELRYDLAIALNNIRNSVRIIRNNAFRI